MDDIHQEKSRLSKYIDQIPWMGEIINPTDKVAVIRMAGVIADSSQMRRAGINFNKYKESIEKAFELPRTKAVAITINSPGGAPAQCSVLSSLIQKLSHEKNIPVFTFVEDVAASGGYWLACLGDEIYAQETSIVGSIGVISASFGLEGFIKKHDVERRIHTSGRDKSFLDPFKPERAEDVARLKGIQAEMHDIFKDWVRTQRGIRLKGTDAELMEGAFWTGKTAVNLGLIDGIGDIACVMRDKFGEDIKFVDFSPEKKSWFTQLIPMPDAKIDIGDILDKAEERSLWARFGS